MPKPESERRLRRIFDESMAVAEHAHAEYGARDGCGLLDRSERGKLALTGAEAQAFLNGQVTNDVEALRRRAAAATPRS